MTDQERYTAESLVDLTNEQLDRMVGARRGWKYACYRIDGKRDWRKVTKYGPTYREELPAWSTDHDTAWQLLRDTVEVVASESTYGVTYNSIDGYCVTVSGIDFCIDGDMTPAKAITIAWLLWWQVNHPPQAAT